MKNNGSLIFQAVSNTVVKNAFTSKKDYQAFVTSFSEKMKPALRKNENERLKSEQQARNTFIG